MYIPYNASACRIHICRKCIGIYAFCTGRTLPLGGKYLFSHRASSRASLKTLTYTHYIKLKSQQFNKKMPIPLHEGTLPVMTAL